MDVEKAVYEKRLADIEALAAPAVVREREAGLRPDAISALQARPSPEHRHDMCMARVPSERFIERGHLCRRRSTCMRRSPPRTTRRTRT